MKIFLLIGANALLVIHVLIVAVIVLGWLVPSLHYYYLTTLIVTFLTQLVFGYCILTKWEFRLRKKLDPSLRQGSTFISHYISRLTGGKFVPRSIGPLVLVFLVVSIFLTVYGR